MIRAGSQSEPGAARQPRQGPAARFVMLAIFVGGAVMAGACQGSHVQEVKPARDSGPDSSFHYYDLGQLSDATDRTDAKCGQLSQKVELLPLDILLALDTSYSMDFDNKWISVREAIKVFVADSRFNGLGLGIQYFPLRKVCSVADYRLPAVSIAQLPGVGDEVVSSLDHQRMFGGTPMVPMLQGALDYARSRAEQDADRKVVVIIATDGIPDNTCVAPEEAQLSNTLANVVALAGQGAGGSPAVSTFVIGVGSELTALNEISRAGSGSDAILVDTAADIKTAFVEALNDIRRLALTCEHEIPPPDTGEINFNYVNVEFSADQQTETFVRVADAAGCAAAPNSGWYYDDPTDPQKIVLCDGACDKVQTSADGQFNVVFGCATILQ